MLSGSKTNPANYIIRGYNDGEIATYKHARNNPISGSKTILALSRVSQCVTTLLYQLYLPQSSDPPPLPYDQYQHQYKDDRFYDAKDPDVDLIVGDA